MGDLGHKLLFALILMAFTLPVASAGLVEVYINNSEDLVIAEEAVTIPYGKDFTLTFQVGGPYRIESKDDNLSAYSINVDVRFLNDLDNREDCSMCAIPSYQTIGDTEEDPGYDEYVARFYSDSAVFEGYSGKLQFAIIIKNRTGGLVWDRVLDIEIGSAPSGSSSSGFSIPELPPIIEDNLLVVGGGILAVIILAILINTFILATEDTTAELYKVRESIDPLTKSLTGVSYETDLPSEEEEEDDDDYTEDLLGEEEEEEFDESKLLAELTGPQKLQSDDEKEEEPEPPKAEPKKPVRKKVVKRTVAKKVIQKAAPPQAAPKKPEVNMGEGIISITCPSCEKVHNVDEDTQKFICGCGRRIRLN
jgi:hypothetical protein